MEHKPECYIPGKPIPEIYSGTPTFMGLPKIRTKTELPQFDVAFNGIPWEGICTWGGYSGCELAAKTIRSSSIRYGGYLPEFDLDVFDFLTGGDYGDIVAANGNVELTHQHIYERIREILAADVFPVTFGGDHSITYPIIKALAEKHNGKIGIVHLDAHMDNLNFYGNEKFARCSPLRRAYELPGINPKNIVHVGIRGPRNHPSGLEAAKKVGATVLTSFEIKERGIDYAVSRALEVANDGTEAVYVTVCSDVLDVAHNPGGPADPCGLSTYELGKFIYGVAAKGINGFDFVEIYPPTDLNNVSSHVCCWMILYALCGLVKSRQISL